MGASDTALRLPITNLVMVARDYFRLADHPSVYNFHASHNRSNLGLEIQKREQEFPCSLNRGSCAYASRATGRWRLLSSRAIIVAPQAELGIG